MCDIERQGRTGTTVILPHGGNLRRPLILKQYGEKRTGTNLLRLLLSRNVPGIIVLMHILGDKHSPPAPFGRIWQESRGADDPDGDFVQKATFSVPADFTRRENLEQNALLNHLAEAVADAYRSGRLGFLISIKSPYAWAVSLARYEAWTDRPPVGDGIACLPRLRDACRRFNDNYAAWLNLHDAHQDRTSIVRYEDLATDPSAVYERLSRHHGWPPAEGRLALPARKVLPTIWDDDPTVEGRVPFHASGLASYDPSSLPEEFRDVISQAIDWELMRRFGYERWEGRVSAPG
jgi:hypothetical protein